MTAEFLALAFLAACVAYWYSRRSKVEKPPTSFQTVQQAVAPPQPESEADSDPFMQHVSAERERIDAAVLAALQQHKQQLEEKFADDVRLKERLSKFARENRFDEALISLWDEIKNYPAWSSRNDFAEWNKLHLTDIIGAKDKDTASVEFTHGGRRFKVSCSRWSGMDSDDYADFSFFENAVEVFGIQCSVEYGNYGTNFRCVSVSALKKQGDWAKALLQLHGQIEIARQKSSAELGYFGAEEIKTRFKE